MHPSQLSQREGRKANLLSIETHRVVPRGLCPQLPGRSLSLLCTEWESEEQLMAADLSPRRSGLKLHVLLSKDSASQPPPSRSQTPGPHVHWAEAPPEMPVTVNVVLLSKALN